MFFRWGEENSRLLELSSAADDYQAWTEHLWHRVKVRKDLQQVTAYNLAGWVERHISLALGMNRALRRRSRLRAPRQSKAVLGSEADKQNLADTMRFGNFLLDICVALPVDVVFGALPVKIPLRTGQELIEWSRLPSPEKVDAFSGIGKPSVIAQSKARRAAWENEKSTRTRFPLVNLRVEAELLVFLAQTGMNLAQAHPLRRGAFRFRSDGDDLLVYRVYKGRRHGEAEFRVFREYRPFFEAYLEWLNTVVPEAEDNRLFPFFSVGKLPAAGTAPHLKVVRAKCALLDIPYFGPQKLRKARINYLLRRSNDLETTAEQAQHSVRTLLTHYEQPHHQLAVAEITRFYKQNDPSIAPPGPGKCVQLNRRPALIPGTPDHAPRPDCVNPAGCLFCDFHRDICSEDYVWALASYRYLKLCELSRYSPPESETTPHPATSVIDRITQKLESFSLGSDLWANWVTEVANKVRESRFHPIWRGFIRLMELSP
jgi:hypothetical protein